MSALLNPATDRVRFMTWDFTSGVGNTPSGCNRFPVPFSQFAGEELGSFYDYGSSSTSDRYFPVKVPVTTLEYWYWRIAAWKVFAFYDGQFWDAAANVEIRDIGTPNNLQFRGVFDSYDGGAGGVHYQQDGSISSPSGYLNLLSRQYYANDLITAPANILQTPSGQLFPSLDSHCSFYFADAAHPLGRYALAATRDGGNTVPCRYFIDGIQIPGARSTGLLDIGEVTISWEPSRYWQYCAEDGTPIYDEWTGEQLQDHHN